MNYLGIDLGGTNIAAAVLDADYRIIARAQRKTACPRPAEQIMDDMCAVAREALAAAHLTAEDVPYIGVGCPGMVLTDIGVIVYANNLGFRDVRMGEYMEQRLGRPIVIDNDANAAALGERWLGAGRNMDSLLLVTLGTGVGGGLVLHGEMMTGAHGSAGEIGHMTVNPGETQLCSCGKRGCLEQYASAGGIVRLAQAAGLRVESAKDVSDLAAWGNERAQGALKKAGRLLGLALSNAACLVDVDGILLGGGVAAAGEALLSPVRDAFYANVFHAAAGTQVALASLGNDAGMYGAARLALGSQSATTAL